ncbi:MAG: sulfite exporter TauE/SafE family protein [Chthoniobacterales bacterium]|nr:sulfite exporter TauE/SafE family protein [Chthoniobacterales bacterium]
MDYLLVSVVAAGASMLTLLSGFGLGTILMPVFALFFPVPAAIAATAVVHLANNLFKIVLLGRRADWPVVLRFGLPSALAAAAGAGALVYFADLPSLAGYELLGRTREVTPVKLVIGVVILFFAVLELIPSFAKLALPRRYLAVGGLLSGFFGGLSGNQGALRSAFLIKAGLGKEAFVATGVVCAVIVDVVRLAVYGGGSLWAHFNLLASGVAGPVAVAIVAAFAGACFGARVLEKITYRAVRLIVAAGMMLVGIGLAAGLI